MSENPQTPAVDGGGLRYNKGKLRWSLLPWDALKVLVQVYEKGAEKYAPRNWERGMSYTSVYDCLQRHLFAWWSGESRDAESGLPHLAHVVWNALALLTYEVRGIGHFAVNGQRLDDRPLVASIAPVLHVNRPVEPPAPKPEPPAPAADTPPFAVGQYVEWDEEAYWQSVPMLPRRDLFANWRECGLLHTRVGRVKHVARSNAAASGWLVEFTGGTKPFDAGFFKSYVQPATPMEAVHGASDPTAPTGRFDGPDEDDQTPD